MSRSKHKFLLLFLSTTRYINVRTRMKYLVWGRNRKSSGVYSITEASSGVSWRVSLEYPVYRLLCWLLQATRCGRGEWSVDSNVPLALPGRSHFAHLHMSPVLAVNQTHQTLYTTKPRTGLAPRRSSPAPRLDKPRLRVAVIRSRRHSWKYQ